MGDKAIFDAIADRDPEAAELAVHRRLTAAWEMVRATFNFQNAAPHEMPSPPLSPHSDENVNHRPT